MKYNSLLFIGSISSTNSGGTSSTLTLCQPSDGDGPSSSDVESMKKYLDFRGKRTITTGTCSDPLTNANVPSSSCSNSNLVNVSGPAIATLENEIGHSSAFIGI